jgi:dsDNA-specific endonuclease/ATPase MutS2
MELRPELLLRGAAKAMTDVVLPALDADNKLAQEQGQLVLASLNFVVQRLPQLYRFDCDELARSVAFAITLSQIADQAGTSGEVAGPLALSSKNGADVLSRAKADPDEVETANRDLREKIGAMVAAICADAPADLLSLVGRVVTANAAEQLQRDRAWVAPQGWEPGAAGLGELDELLAGHGTG